MTSVQGDSDGVDAGTWVPVRDEPGMRVDSNNLPFGFRLGGGQLGDEPEDEVYAYQPEPLTLGSLAAPSDDDGYRSARPSGSSAAHPVTGQTLRAVLTIGLTSAVVIMVFLGLILRLPPPDFAQYVAPLTGIAGLALGYWFGTDKNT